MIAYRKMTLNELQKKHPVFLYKGYSWKMGGNDLKISFSFSVGPDISFSPEITVKGVDGGRLKKLDGAALDSMVFHVGLAEIPSYWKAACPPKIVIACGHLDRKQIRFWQNLYEKSMGQFFFENRIPEVVPDFIIDFPKPDKSPALKNRFADKYLVPIGGGKDSLVTLEILKEAKKDISTFVLRPNAILEKLTAMAGTENISVDRVFDRRLLELNKRGYLNGHTPFSAYLAFTSVLAAAVSGCRRIAISQERSSNEGNLEYLGRTINHQYTKTLEFEDRFRGYAADFLAKNIEFFSFLRPLYEIQIAAIFAGLEKYFPFFMSCNKPYKFSAPQENNWCGACPKCLFTFAALYPFLGKERIIRIFGKNLFENENLLPLMRSLIGADPGSAKPFECVGTRRETLAAFYLSFEKEKDSKDLPVLLRYFRDSVLPKNPGAEKAAAAVMSSWDSKNNVPKALARKLRSKAAGFVSPGM